MTSINQADGGVYILLNYVPQLQIELKVAGFDLDWTLVRPIKSKYPISKLKSEWRFLPNRLSMLKNLQQQGYVIAIFTNQKYKGQLLTTALTRLQEIMNELKQNGINAWMAAATEDNYYRKPNVGMWSLFRYTFNQPSVIGFYCGDAAGRPQDFSDSDQQLVININNTYKISLHFLLPEQVFHNSIPINFNERLMILVGVQGSGKTSLATYIQQHNPNTFVIDGDVYKNINQQLRLMKENLAVGKNVVIAATNPTQEKRQKFITDSNLPTNQIIIYWLANNGDSWNDLRDKPVPNVAINTYYSRLQLPSQTLDNIEVKEVWW